MTNNIYLKGFEPGCLKIALDSLSVYRKLLEDNVVNSIYKLLSYLSGEKKELGEFANLYNDFFFSLACRSHVSLKEYIIESILFNENPYTQYSERKSVYNNESIIKSAASNDLDYLQLISCISSRDIKAYALNNFCESDFGRIILEKLPEWAEKEPFNVGAGNYPSYFLSIKDKLNKSSCWSELLEDITEFHKNWGTGMFARHRAFVWERSGDSGYLKGIDKPDTVLLSDLIGYEVERAQVVENTIQFVTGYPANNVLLYGDRGTGKSSTVKALLNEYYEQGLRMIEVPKNYLLDFPDIIRDLKDRTQKFILFVDDLAFEDNEDSYTALKAVLEGGLESKPKNVIIYATSNRRHLVKEKFSDRAGLHSGNHDEEVRSADNMQEKLSLADRFGITVVFTSPDKNRYLKIVEGIAAKRGIAMDKAKLHSEALKWGIWYNGRSPRTARQFVDWLEGEVGK